MVQEEMPPNDALEASVPRAKWWRSGWIEPVVIVILALVLNLAGNGRTGLWDRDEPRYAVCVREMRARGDWIFPTFNGEPRYHKPILIYWLMGLGTALGGDNPFGVRLVSAFAGAATVLGVWVLGQKDVRPARRAAGRLDPGDRADRGRRVEAGDNRRDAGPLAVRMSVLPLGAGSAAVTGRRRPLLGLLEPGDLDQGAGRSSLDRVVVAPGLVVGVAGLRVETIALAGRTRWFCTLDVALVRGHQHLVGRRVPPVCRGPADRPPRCLRHGGTRRFPGLLSRWCRPWSSIPGQRSFPRRSPELGCVASPIPPSAFC